MRIWCGDELEGGDLHQRTLFVEAQHLTDKDLETVSRLCGSCNASRVYFGAGRTDVTTRFDASKVDAKTVIETSPARLQTAIDCGCQKVVVRVDVDADLKENTVLKIDNKKIVLVSTSTASTDLADLDNGLYKNDREVYNDEKTLVPST